MVFQIGLVVRLGAIELSPALCYFKELENAVEALSEGLEGTSLRSREFDPERMM